MNTPGGRAHRRRPRGVLPLLFAGMLLAQSGCAPTHETASPSAPSSAIASRDGGFSYQIPRGWFDASADSQAQDHAALLIRNDYGATIAVDEVHLDDAARSELQRNGLVPVARLLVSLSSWDRDAILTMAPRLINLGDTQACRYGLASGNGEDAVEVTLVNSGEKLYAVRVLVSGKSRQGRELLRSVQEAFLGAVRW